MVVGVTDGFTKELEIVGVGYRATAQGPTQARAGARLQPPGRSRRPRASTFEVPATDAGIVIVRGIDKEMVGQVAADIRKIRKPEPYKGKGVRYAGEHVIRKAGKAGQVGTDDARMKKNVEPRSPAPPPGPQEGPRHRRASPPGGVPLEPSTSSPR